MENMTVQEALEVAKQVTLGGAGWAIAILLAWYITDLQKRYETRLSALQSRYDEMLIEQKKEAIDRARLLEQRLFDLKASLVTVE